jgi:protein SCO1
MNDSLRIVALAALALAAAAAGVAASVWLRDTGRSDTATATVLDAPRALPDFTLVDDHGRTVTRAGLAGRWTLLFFGFTHCPDVCPMTLQVLARAQQALEDAPGELRPAIAFVSVDPGRDKPGQLAHYVAAFDADLRGLTGDDAALTTLTKALGAAYVRVDGANGDYTMDHTAAVFLLDPQARYVAVFTPPHDARTIAADVRAIAARAPS